MRTFGLDYGTKTIGVAVSDGLGLTAQTVTTVRRASLKADLAELSRLVKEYEVTRFVLGLPLNMNGSEGPRAEASRKFADVLGQALGLPVELWDERLSTVAAQRTLLEADVSRAKRREVIDQLAAQFILQGWLDAHRAPVEEGYDPEDYDPEA
ncbi:Holliday junction resolvase RuvX [Corallococcus praedator]|uniref:Putative pre-16S rRNA nuclease n=1 Tax=Corallococcus praedator TaxID=2316724 RepID=A0ABX9Q4J4_9BACT|nr:MULTISPECIES: Holliday junction resolvase RuvX [Corallococcus]RKG97617.1 Holliday junction resolvase RuvX [Corallococcus sp. CA047B]RKH18231.1 Holliday junction resolvase RuvX [Corallococcus sp. CA031C]RKH90005.1 Holliday junction resolvase RuvX [Corallococcus praedator]